MGYLHPYNMAFYQNLLVNGRKCDISPCNICFKEYLHSISHKIYNILCLITIFLLGHGFQIFAKVADFEENFFRVKKYTVSNFFICQYIGIELPA